MEQTDSVQGYPVGVHDDVAGDHETVTPHGRRQ